MRSRLGRQTVLALYALAMMFVGFVNTSQMAVGHSSVAAGDYLASSDAPSRNCYQDGNDVPLNDALRCCDACTLSAAPDPRAVPLTPVAYVLDIIREFDAPAVSGSASDFTPENIRSRAPPARV